MRHFLSLAALAVLELASVTMLCQATVYVDPVAGSNLNTGAQTSPLKTIFAATQISIANTKKNIGTAIMLNPGIYRETVSIGGVTGQSNMKLAAFTSGTAIISGSNLVTGWASIGNGEYTAKWVDTLPTCTLPTKWPNVPPIAIRNEMVFINGTPLTQILNKADHRVGTFYVDKTAQMLHVWTSTNPATATVEVATRPQTLQVHNTTGLTISGIVFKNAGGCMNTSSVNINSSKNVSMSNVAVQWNNWGGIVVQTSNGVTLQNTKSSYNGGQGFSGFSNINVTLTTVDTSYNNWRGAMGAFYDFGMGGTKFGHLHGGQITGLTAYNNHGEGLWFDTDNKSVTINSSIFVGNAIDNLKVEASQGPFTVTNSSFCSSGVGVLVFDVPGVTLTGNNIYDNGDGMKWQAELFIAGQPTGRSFTDFQTGQHLTTFTINTTLSNNVITDGRTKQFLFGTYYTGANWTNFTKTLHSSSNVWHDSLLATPFLVPNLQEDNLSGWQNMTGQDANSATTASSIAARNCTAPAPAYPDFMLFANNHAGQPDTNQVAPYPMSGETVTVPLQVHSYGFGPVSLATSALPTGVTASFSSPTLQSGTTMLTFKGTSHVVTANVPVTIFATSGGRVHSVTLLVGVKP